MQLRHFVSGSALVLTGWLAVTFLYEVPSQRYPKLDKYPTTALSPRKTTPPDAKADADSPVVQVSLSR